MARDEDTERRSRYFGETARRLEIEIHDQEIRLAKLKAALELFRDDEEDDSEIPKATTTVTRKLSEPQRSTVLQAILAVLADGRPKKATDIIKLLKQSYQSSSVRFGLAQGVKTGQLGKQGYGVYRIKP